MTNVTYKRKRRRPGCMLILLTIAILVGGYIWLNKDNTNLPFGNPLSSTMAEYGSDEFPNFEETWSCGHGSNKVIRIPIAGMITLNNSESILTPNGTADFALRAIHRATLDDNVKAIILEIDSGGGGITASDIIYNSLLEFKKDRSDRKVVAICGDLAASGAYYIALAADHIITRPTTSTGSIGVLMPSVNIHELGMKYGIKDATIKSGENKDIFNPLNDLTDKKRAILQSVVDAMHDRFVKLVVKNRNISEQEVRELADGRIFTATEAMQLGLTDEIGYWKDAMIRTTELLNVDNIIVYRYEDEFSFSDLLRAGKTISPRAWLGLDSSPRLQYRWQP